MTLEAQIELEPCPRAVETQRAFIIAADIQVLAAGFPDPGDEMIMCKAVAEVIKRHRSPRTTGLRVMGFIWSGCTKVSELFKEMSLSRPRLLEAIEYLETSGYVAPTSFPTGGRPSKGYRLTKSGESALVEMKRSYPGIFE